MSSRRLKGFRISATFISVVVALGIIGTTAAIAAATWTAKANVPSIGLGIEGMSVGVSDGYIVAAYGYDNGFGDTNTTRIYSMATDSWSFGADAPGPVRSEGIGVMRDGKLYSIGGRSGGVLNNLDRYQKTTNTWVSLAPMPTARAGLGGAGGVGPGRYIYAIGGRDGTVPCTGSALSVVERYDTQTDSWATMAPLPVPTSDLGAIQMGNGKIYVFGGCDASRDVTGNVWVYTIATNTWSPAPPMPTPRAEFYQVGFAGPNIYVIGGADSADAVSGANEVFNTSTNTWGPPALPMLTPRGEMGVGSNGGTIWTVGGAMPSMGSSSNALETFRP